MRPSKILSISALAALAAFSACGGQSLQSDDDGSSGDAGAGQSGAGGTTSGRGGTSSVGGSPAGGVSGTIAVGGSSVGGSSVGGSSFGGSSVGGSSFGGVAGTSGSAGAAGAGGICSLPLVSGPCDAYFPSFGFSEVDGSCQPFVYGGCQGNENRFSTLAECEAKCGGSLSACPAHAPRSEACMINGQRCTYDYDDCLCAPKEPFTCTKIDAACTRPAIDGGISEIVVVAYTECTCLAPAPAWNCQYVTYGGGPP